jgi:catechol 2,3-dioxygenase-like lactoylglutathione lyase family enzyme
MIQTHGLTHLSLAVADPERSLRFYAQVFGVREYFRDEESIQALGPGPHDVLAFELHPASAGVSGGVRHFGFRLKDPADIDLAVQEVERAGGKLLKRGEFKPGFPFAYVADPDGYKIEIWYE